MKKALMVAVMAAVMSVVTGFADDAAVPAPVQKAAPKAACFVCAKCQKVSMETAKCCGQDMKAMNVMSIKDGVATCCSCPAGCKCGEVKDGKCGCGKPVVTCYLGGKFVCEKCGMVSDKPGKCCCGAALVEVPAKDKTAK